MTTPSTRSPDADGPPVPSDGDDDYSPAFAARALMLTSMLLVAPAVALWVLDAL